MGQLPPGSEPDYAGLFAEPSIDRMLAPHLTPHQFEHFVKYVFEQAGYFVEDAAGQYGQGIDLRLFTGPLDERVLRAGVSVKQFTPPGQVNGQQMMNFHGALRGMRGYAVTTSTFNGPALAEAEQSPRIWPIDGAHLLRYINYVRGSHSADTAEEGESDTRLRGEPSPPVAPEVLLAADDIARRPPRETTVLTLANNKGGVGKTTTALNFAFGLARPDPEPNQQVLLVDLDPQANLTRALPPKSPNGTQWHIGDYFAGRCKLSELIRETKFDRVWLIPSDNALTLRDRGVSAAETILRFVRDLHAAETAPPKVLDMRPFDWIIIDTGPSMGLFTRAGLAASHDVLMPVAPGAFADMAPDLLESTVRAMEALTGAQITILGSLVTQWKDDRLHDDLWDKAKFELDGHGIAPFAAQIPDDKTNIERAHLESGSGAKKMLFSHHKKSKAAQAYEKALEELLKHVKPQQGE
ncbi:MAG TPA: AAA family ATPase [Ktedonobacterales bacterium]